MRTDEARGYDVIDLRSALRESREEATMYLSGGLGEAVVMEDASKGVAVMLRKQGWSENVIYAMATQCDGLMRRELECRARAWKSAGEGSRSSDEHQGDAHQ